jgi:hypothetical protein
MYMYIFIVKSSHLRWHKKLIDSALSVVNLRVLVFCADVWWQGCRYCDTERRGAVKKETRANTYIIMWRVYFPVIVLVLN